MAGNNWMDDRERAIRALRQSDGQPLHGENRPSLIGPRHLAFAESHPAFPSRAAG